ASGSFVFISRTKARASALESRICAAFFWPSVSSPLRRTYSAAARTYACIVHPSSGQSDRLSTSSMLVGFGSFLEAVRFAVLGPLRTIARLSHCTYRGARNDYLPENTSGFPQPILDQIDILSSNFKRNRIATELPRGYGCSASAPKGIQNRIPDK